MLVISGAVWALAGLTGVFMFANANIVKMSQWLAILCSNVLMIIDGIIYLSKIVDDDMTSASYLHCLCYMVFNIFFSLGVVFMMMKYKVVRK